MIGQMVGKASRMACASVVLPIETFAAEEGGHSLHWYDGDKIRIVEESLRVYRQDSTYICAKRTWPVTALKLPKIGRL